MITIMFYARLLKEICLNHKIFIVFIIIFIDVLRKKTIF